MFIKHIDFEQLKALLLERIGQPGMPSQAAARNTLSALAAFLGERNIATSDTVGSTLRLSFYREREEHLATLRAAGKSIAYVRNRSSLLGHWHRLIRALDHEAAALDRAPTPLQVGLRSALEGRRFKRTANDARMSPQTLRRWMAGTLPRPGTDHYLSRLEEVCGLLPRALTDLLPYNAVLVADSGGYGPAIEYRLRLSHQTQDRYKLTAAMAIAALRAEWRELLAYKTSGSSRLDPSVKISALEQLRGALAVESSVSKKQWRVRSPDRSERLRADRWVDVISGQVCATADLVFNYAAGFMGWAQLPAERGGRGLSAESAQTLGLFCDQDLIGAFIEWRVARSEGINGWIVSFLAFAAMLLNPKTGFLTAQTDIAARNGFAPTAWAERCNAAHEWVNTYKRKISGLVMPSRDPKDAIRHSLELAMPLTNFTLAIRRMETRWPTTGGEAEAIHARDLLLLALLTSNPLRALNLRQLTYYPDNTGQLRQTSSGEWRIVIERHQFKNTKTAGGDGDYDQAVDESVWPHIRRYLKDYRKVLGGSRPELVFVSTVDPNRTWGTGLNRRFEALTRRYVPGCPGVGPHAMRHIVATSLIMQGEGSEASVARAARALRDSPATVRRHYRHLLASFGDRQHKEALGGILAGMAPKPFSPPEPTGQTA